MWMRLTVDAALKVHAAEAETIAGALPDLPAGGPGGRATGRPDHRARLAGKVRRRIGGANGCTHIVEMLQPLATVAFQTVFADRRKWSDEAKQWDKSEKPPHIDSLLRAAFRRRSGARALSDLVHRVRRRQAQNQRLTPRAARLSRRHRAPGREPRARAPDPRARRPIPRRPNVGVRHASSRQTRRR